MTPEVPNRDRSLSALADMAGFASLSAFSRWFRDRFGTTPTAWRSQSNFGGDKAFQ